MKNWLVKIAEQTKSEDEVLHEQLQSLDPEVLQELAYEFDPASRPTQMDAMSEKIASVQRIGRELAQEHGDDLEKQALAFLAPLVGMAGRAIAGQGLKSMAGSVAKNVAKDAIVNKATSAVGNALRPAQPAAQAAGMAAPAMGGGGFNYGKVAFDLKGMGQAAAGFLHKNPGAALSLAGAGVGALMAPRDPMTGQKQYLRGALMGGGVAAGAHALSDGRLGQKAMGMITRQQNPIFGQGARRFMIESSLATRKGGAGAAGALGKMAPSSVPEEAYQAARAASGAGSGAGAAGSTYNGGPTMGNVKLAFAGMALRKAYMAKLATLGLTGNAAAGAAKMFSTKISPAAAGASVRSGMGGMMNAAKKPATPPPIPGRAMGGGATPPPIPTRPAAGGAAGPSSLASVQQSLNGARSVMGGGPMMPSGGGATIRAMPGSGW